ncbi:uncharacterized protein BJ171DRAFT_486533 [Polychytrium aggregatum]|uniref:uncharacterized protein n=1 Tax=Polychytrium aggregatum TaxID=110093 RepID=UPI0022FE8310|nr:uncharacterized protein BJ171DRAFT_486533 [Polychytrium aggregatum]KAI9209351.1 hypothetical protein BJ171DRAFT_486533 [Polychytrium aggregatum]
MSSEGHPKADAPADAPAPVNPDDPYAGMTPEQQQAAYEAWCAQYYAQYGYDQSQQQQGAAAANTQAPGAPRDAQSGLNDYGSYANEAGPRDAGSWQKNERPSYDRRGDYGGGPGSRGDRGGNDRGYGGDRYGNNDSGGRFPDSGPGGRGGRFDGGSDRYGSGNDRYGTGSNRYDDGPSRGFGDSRPRDEPEDDTKSKDTIYVSGLPETVTAKRLGEFFGVLGIIKIDKKTREPKIWVYRDKVSGVAKGDATITFDDPPTSGAAIQWFNGKEFDGNVIKVERASQKAPPPGGYSRGGRGRGGGGRGGGGPGGRPGSEPGDWVCSSCSNNNFARRSECFRCRAPKPDGAFGGADAGYGGRGFGGGGGGGDRGFGGRGGSDIRDRRQEDRRSHRDRPY